jgi:hypothetical protein
MRHNQGFPAALAGRKWLFLLPLCVLGLVDLVLEHPAVKAPPVRENRVVDFVTSRYLFLEEGRYQELSPEVAEGLWEREDVNRYRLTGLVARRDMENQLEDDLGVGGWRVRFVTLKAVAYSEMDRRAFSTFLRRESQVLDLLDPSQSVQSVSVVTMSGHNTGRCSIIEWERPVPVVKLNGRYIILMRGTPDVYALEHNEQWFLPVRF